LSIVPERTPLEESISLPYINTNRQLKQKTKKQIYCEILLIIAKYYTPYDPACGYDYPPPHVYHLTAVANRPIKTVSS